jgi:hypothetical protein
MACSTCMVGDPTLTLMGVEKPYEDRLRFSVFYASRSEELGVDGFNKKVIDDQRLSLDLVYAPSTRLMLGVNLPYVKRQLDSFNLLQEEVTGLGDTTIEVKTFMQEKEFMQKHMYGLLGGLKLPTASEVDDADGVPLDFDVQVGQGATVVNAGAWYGYYNFPYLLYTSATCHIASEGYQEFQAGDTLVYNATAQYTSGFDVAYYLGLQGRSSQKDTFAGVEDPDSGGTIVYIAPGIVYALVQDLLLNATLKFPVVDALDGDHEEGNVFIIGLTYDFKMH